MDMGAFCTSGDRDLENDDETRSLLGWQSPNQSLSRERAPHVAIASQRTPGTTHHAAFDRPRRPPPSRSESARQVRIGTTRAERTPVRQPTTAGGTSGADVWATGPFAPPASPPAPAAANPAEAPSLPATWTPVRSPPKSPPAGSSRSGIQRVQSLTLRSPSVIRAEQRTPVALRVAVDLGTVYASAAYWNETYKDVVCVHNQYQGERILGFVNWSPDKKSWGKDAAALVGKSSQHVIRFLKRRLFDGCDSRAELVDMAAYALRMLVPSEYSAVGSLTFCVPGCATPDFVQNLRSATAAAGFAGADFICDTTAALLYDLRRNSPAVELYTVLVVALGAGYYTATVANVARPEPTSADDRRMRLHISLADSVSAPLGSLDVIFCLMRAVYAKAISHRDPNFDVAAETFRLYTPFFLMCQRGLQLFADPDVKDVKFFVDGECDVRFMPGFSESDCDSDGEVDVVLTRKEVDSIINEAFLANLDAELSTLRTDNCQYILLAGGFSGNPCVRTYVERKFRKPLREVFELQKAFAIGAGLYATAFDNPSSFGNITVTGDPFLSSCNGVGHAAIKH